VILPCAAKTPSRKFKNSQGVRRLTSPGWSTQRGLASGLATQRHPLSKAQGSCHRRLLPWSFLPKMRGLVRPAEAPARRQDRSPRGLDGRELFGTRPRFCPSSFSEISLTPHVHRIQHCDKPHVARHVRTYSEWAARVIRKPAHTRWSNTPLYRWAACQAARRDGPTIIVRTLPAPPPFSSPTPLSEHRG